MYRNRTLLAEAAREVADVDTKHWQGSGTLQ